MLIELVAAVALASLPLQDPQTTDLGDIVVDGRSVESQARDYVAEIAEAPGTMRLARWGRRLCVGVTGLDAAYAQFLVDRISAVAASVGIDPGDPGCRPDVLIAFTRDPDALAQAWVAEDIDRFRPTIHNGTDLGGEALNRFRSSDAPIRWWHTSLSVNAQTGLVVTVTGSEESFVPSFNAVNTPSLISSSTRERLVNTFIVVDADRIGPVSFGSLSDYLALVALTQVDPDAETEGFNTVLNLFSTQPTARLSPWDFDYLQSLYRMNSNAIRATREARQLAATLADRRAGDGATAPAQ